jgi:hypothetical protein
MMFTSWLVFPKVFHYTGCKPRFFCQQDEDDEEDSGNVIEQPQPALKPQFQLDKL